LVVVNPGSGSADDGGGLGREAGTRLGRVRTIELSDPGVEGAVDEAVAEGRVVVAAGGDGTANAVAQHVVGKGVLGVLPGGTLNHFARDLGVEDVDTALRALEAGHAVSIDVGRVNGDRYFLNNAGVGLYPELVHHRERAQDRAGKWLAAAGAAVTVLRDSEPVSGTITADDDPRTLFAWMVFVGNNRFGTTPGRVGRRERLDEGILDVGLFLAGPRGARRSSVAWRVFRSRAWQTSSRVIRHEAHRVQVRIHGDPRPISWDGEAGDPVREMEAEILPRALRVVVPPRD
jgi:undecaprenyl-diphosphatase